MGDLTQYLSRKDFTCRCGCGRTIVDSSLLLKLQTACNIYGGPLVVCDAYRCKQHDEELSGRETEHRYGKAVHVQCTPETFGEVVVSLILAGFRCLQLPIARNHVHVELGNGHAVINIYDGG